MKRCHVSLMAVVWVSAVGFGCTADKEPIAEGQLPSVETPQIPLDGAGVPKYVEPLPTFSGRRSNGNTTQQVQMVEFQQRILPASIYAGLSAPFNAGSFQWGYRINNNPPSWPAVTIEAHRGNATTAIYTNNLQGPNGTRPVLARYLTYDQTLHWADPLGLTRANRCVNGPPLAGPCLNPYTGPIPAVTHLHGAEVLSQYDGHPDAWWTPNQAIRGPGFVTATYNYVNQQEATQLWFHDHALGVVRLNVYSGLAGMYLIRDNRDTGLPNNPIGLPAGNFEQELLLADRQFDTNGQILFPDGTPPDNPTGINGGPPNPDHHPFWIPEFFGDVMVVNGKSWPFFQVEPRRYRFRIVNSSNARFLRMSLVNTANGAVGPAIWQIGSDGGFLNAPVRLANNASALKLILAPAERADIIIDFAGQSGRTFILTNDAEAPFPSGDPPDPDTCSGVPSPACTSGQIMQFRVNLPLSSADTSFNPANPQRSLRASPIVDIKPADTGRPADKRRDLILVEVEGDGGPEEVLLNNSHWNGNREGTTMAIPGSLSNGRGLSSTENPQQGATEIWEVANLTEDAHPIHIHLIQFQVINRQTFDRDGYRALWDSRFPGGTFNGITYPPGTFIPGFGPPQNYATANAVGAVGGNPDFTPFLDPQGITPPDPNEAGWKDTLRMPPLSITRIAVRWAPTTTAVAAVRAGQPAFPFDPTTGGPGYVWHCHILDHEDNEMMRPYLVTR
jgi:spore coat protein A